MDAELFNLNSKITIVTGATHGIGMVIASGMHAEGASMERAQGKE